MSTLVHFNDRCPDQESLVSFLYDEFDASDALDRRTISRHIETCDRCARQLASLGGVRDRLRAWQVPEISPLAFRIGTGAATGHGAGAGAGWSGWMKPAFPLAAAAVLVLGAALGLARLDIQYDKDGFRLHTGWQAHEDQTARGLTPGSGTIALDRSLTLDRGANATPAVMGASAGGPNLLAPNTDANRQPWHADMQMLAQTLRQEIIANRQTPDAGGGRIVPTSAADAALIKRVQQLIDQAEVRQQQNLALRITEVSREFDLQRRSDLAQIEQGFAGLKGQREVDAQQQRLLLNAIRASQQTSAPR